jgi:hypothetical protein
MKYTLLKSSLPVALFALLGASSAMAAIDPVLLALAPADAKILMGIQVDQSQNTAFGQYILSRIGPNTGLDRFVTATGFDPRRDLKQILVASSGKQNNGLVLARGIFQPERLTTAAALAGAVKTTYAGIDLYASAQGNPGNGTLAFLDSSTALVGDDAQLKAAIDRYRSGAAFRGPLGTRANELSNLYQAWFVTNSFTDLTNMSGTGGQIPQNALQSILQVAGGLKLSADAVTVALEAATGSDKDAQSLVDVVKFFTSMIQMNRNNDANAARAAAIFDTASITASGPTLRMSIAVPEKDLEQMVGQPGAKTNAAPRRRRQ